MTSISTLAPLAVPTTIQGSDDPLAVEKLKSADKALNGLLHDPALLQSLTDQTITYIPPTTGQVISTLWALMNVNETDNLTKLDLQKAVHSAGGTQQESDALWSFINPDNANSVTAKEFISASYLNAAASANIQAETDAVENNRLQATVKANANTSNILEMYSGVSPVQGNSSLAIFI